MLVSIADQYGRNQSIPSPLLDVYAYQHIKSILEPVMNTSSLARPLRLHRPWAARAGERIAIGFATLVQRIHGAVQRIRERRREARDLQAALDLSQATLRDMGAPEWLQARAEAHRDAQRFERELLRIEPRPSGLRYF
jgi:hypothetical protein